MSCGCGSGSAGKGIFVNGFAVVNFPAQANTPDLIPDNKKFSSAEAASAACGEGEIVVAIVSG